MVAVVQLVRASDCGSECRGFESHLPPNRESNFKRGLTLFYPRFKKPGSNNIVVFLTIQYYCLSLRHE